MISINATLFLQIVHFLILMFILNRLMFRPVLRIIHERNRHIEDEKNQLDTIEKETRELMDKCVAMERDARRDAGGESTHLKREAMEAAEKILSDTRHEVTAIRVKAEEEIDAKLEEAQQSLRKEAAILAGELIVKLIGRRVAH